MGGVGKTSLARAYANRHLDDYGVVWWVRAEDPSAIDAEFRALLEALLPPAQAAEIGDARTAAFNLLAAQQDPWLLVLDNLPDAAAAHGLLPPAGNGRVLITSRDPRWSEATAIEPLDIDAAVQLLGDSDEEAAKALAAELGGLPLALTQAAGFVRANAISLATYLRLYRARSAELHKEAKPADYPHTVATTWQLAMDRLTDDARGVLNLIAFYAPDAIPVHLLFASWDELTRIRAVGELHSYGLITPAGEDKITVHRLVQAVTRNRLRTNETAHEWADQAHELIMEAMPERLPTATSLAIWTALHTHVLALLEHLPPEHLDTLETRNDLAVWTAAAGNAAHARDLFDELLLIQERVLGAEHPDTLDTRHDLAIWAGEAGDPVRARDLLAELLLIQERVLGAEHPDTLATRRILAHWTGAAGDAVRAQDLLASVLAIQERMSGAEHPDTLATRHDLAGWIGEAGNVVRARDLFSALRPIEERIWGAEHPNTLMTQHNLAFWTGEAGDVVRARDLFSALLPVRERVLGAEHPDTLITRYNLAMLTGRAGDAVRARDILAELLPVRERVLGAEHPATLNTRDALEYWSSGSGEEEGPGGGGEC